MIKRIIGVFILSLTLAQGVLAAPKIQHWTTDKNLDVYFVPVEQIPMLDLRLVFAGGSAYDNGHDGLANMTAAMLNNGAEGLSADELADQFESVGAVASSGSARDMAWITLRSITLERELETAFDTWLKMIGKPDFPQKDFERLQKQMLIGLQAEKQSPETIARKAFAKHLYGDHPYGQPENGTEESIEKLTTQQLQAFYKKHYVTQNGLLAIVGNVDRKQAEALAKRVSDQLDRGEAAQPLPKVEPLKAAKTVRIPFPSEQAHVIMGQTGNKRGDPDYYTLYFGNHIMGGSGFTSRLMKAIRDGRGLAYSTYSYFSPRRELGPFILGLQTKISQTDEAIEVARDVVTKYRKKGPSEKEIIAAKKDITGSFPMGVASNSDIIGYLGMIGFYGLPLDYLDTFTLVIDQISQQQIIETFNRRIHPDKMLTVIVGGEEEKGEEGKEEEEKKKTDSDEQAADDKAKPEQVKPDQAKQSKPE